MSDDVKTVAFVLYPGLSDLNRLAEEQGQPRAALEFSADAPGEATVGLRLAADLWL